MTIHINEVLPLLDTILEQQRTISGSLLKLVTMFKKEPEPVEPTLRLMLKPLVQSMGSMKTTLSPTSNQDGFSVNQNE